MEADKPAESKYAGLSKGQIKKIKEKEKKEKDAAAAAAAGGEVGAAMEDAPKAGPAAAGKGKKATKGKGGLSEAANKVIADRQAAEMEEKALIA